MINHLIRGAALTEHIAHTTTLEPLSRGIALYLPDVPLRGHKLYRTRSTVVYGVCVRAECIMQLYLSFARQMQNQSM